MKQWTTSTVAMSLVCLTSAACTEADVVGQDVARKLMARVEGPGSGEVVFEPSGEPCSIESGRCAVYYDDLDVTARAVPDPVSSVLVGWSPVCGAREACVVNLRETVALTASFGVKSYGLNLCREGSGTIRSTASDEPCAAETCRSEHEYGSFVALTALPSAGSRFTRWAGAACADATSETCLVEIGGETEVCAVFADEQLDVRTGSVATLLSFPPATSPDCWFSGMLRATRQTATEVIVATSSHHGCDTEVDVLRVHVAPIGSSHFTTTVVATVDYVGQHSEVGSWGRGIPSDISAAVDQAGRPHILAPVRFGSDGNQPDRYMHAQQLSDGRWSLTRDVVDVGVFTRLHGNQRGGPVGFVGGVVDFHPVVGQLVLFGHHEAWFEETYRVAAATYSAGAWTEFESVYSSTTTGYNHPTIAGTDQAYDAEGRGARAWIDKPTCSVVVQTFLPDQGWLELRELPLASRWCTTDPNGAFGFSGAVHVVPVRGGFDALVHLRGQQSDSVATYHRLRWRGEAWSMTGPFPARWTTEPVNTVRAVSIGGQLHAAYIAPSRNSIILERMDDGSVAELFTTHEAAIQTIDADRIEPRAITWVTRDRVTGEMKLQARPIHVEID